MAVGGTVGAAGGTAVFVGVAVGGTDVAVLVGFDVAVLVTVGAAVFVAVAGGTGVAVGTAVAAGTLVAVEVFAAAEVCGGRSASATSAILGLVSALA